MRSESQNGRPRSRFPGRWLKRAAMACLAMMLAAGGVAASSFYFPSVRKVLPSSVADVYPAFDRLAVAAGFGVTQLAVTGYSNTSDSEIFKALGSIKGQSIFFVDLDAARQRVEKLAWVDRAVMTRVLPGDVQVHIIEREPFAVWRRRNLFFLIDAQGAGIGACATARLCGAAAGAG